MDISDVTKTYVNSDTGISREKLEDIFELNGQDIDARGVATHEGVREVFGAFLAGSPKIKKELQKILTNSGDGPYTDRRIQQIIREADFFIETKLDDGRVVIATEQNSLALFGLNQAQIIADNKIDRTGQKKSQTNCTSSSIFKNK